ncbi:MAG: hypothetical protein F4Y57_02985 [Acidobacteria bacterium]|nr:hypothetical protein [Acidobacteriota bacterium]
MHGNRSGSGARHLRFAAYCAAALVVAAWAATAAQQRPRQSEQRVAGPGETQFNLQLLRPSGGPVIPIFEGWYQHPDGSYELSFGYFNVNTEEVLEIPIGPDNFIEPSRYDGLQPTHFLPMPEGDRRHWGVFTVSVPADFGEQDVVWTLRVDGRTYSVPGRVTRSPYQLHGWIFPGDTTASPLLAFDPAGEPGRGPWGVRHGPLQATVGPPRPQTAGTTRAEPMRDHRRPHHGRGVTPQGPGSVTFSRVDDRLESEAWRTAGAGGKAETEATFSAPGEYVLRALAYNTIREFEFQCCWTNGYVHVNVTD